MNGYHGVNGHIVKEIVIQLDFLIDQEERVQTLVEEVVRNVLVNLLKQKNANPNVSANLVIGQIGLHVLKHVVPVLQSVADK